MFFNLLHFFVTYSIFTQYLKNIFKSSLDAFVVFRWLKINQQNIYKRLTPNAEYLLVRRWSEPWFNSTSDFGLGGFFGRRMTLASSRISSSNSLLSDETDNCRFTRSCSLTLFQFLNSETEPIEENKIKKIRSDPNRRAMNQVVGDLICFVCFFFEECSHLFSTYHI